MQKSHIYKPVDYLLIGHITHDKREHGFTPGGTVTFSGLTARALGRKVGIVTSGEKGIDTSFLKDIQVHVVSAKATTSFKNVITPEGRVQYAYAKAANLNLASIPEEWRNAPIVHLGPVLQEIDQALVGAFQDSFVGVTPQGWLRSVDAEHHVNFKKWTQGPAKLAPSDAVILSVEDVRGDENYIEELATNCKILVVTEGYNGSRLYWNNDVRRFTAPKVQEVDPTGAGDIFAASFFTRMAETNDPWESARFATAIASLSVSRAGLHGIPTKAEINRIRVEVL